MDGLTENIVMYMQAVEHPELPALSEVCNVRIVALSVSHTCVLLHIYILYVYHSIGRLPDTTTQG